MIGGGTFRTASFTIARVAAQFLSMHPADSSG
jgi:hypothetical protein